MKRSDALAELSRDHHHGLFIAQKLRRATPASAPAAREAFLDFWHDEGHQHFRIEEDTLLPAVAHRIDPTDPSIVRVLTDHVDLRRRAAELAATPTSRVEDLRALAARLDAHIRHEERTLFPLIEANLSEGELADLLAAIRRAHG